MRAVKVVLVGDAKVGKSCIVRRIIENSYDEFSNPTIGVAFQTKIISTEHGETVKLQIWDTAGQEQYRSLAKMYFRNANIALLVFSLIAKATFLSLNEWVPQILADSTETKFIVIGNKCDLPNSHRVISREEGMEFSHSINAITYLETSAKNGSGIEELISAISDCDFSQVITQAVPLSRSNDSVRDRCC